MDEEMEYAEMLEIPVSTVNVTKKRGRKPKKQQDLKEKVITKINDQTNAQESENSTAQSAVTAQEQRATTQAQKQSNTTAKTQKQATSAHTQMQATASTQAQKYASIATQAQEQSTSAHAQMQVTASTQAQKYAPIASQTQEQSTTAHAQMQAQEQAPTAEFIETSNAPLAQPEAAYTPADPTAQTSPFENLAQAIDSQEEPFNAIVSESAPISIPRRKKRPFLARLFGGKENEWEYEQPQPTLASDPFADEFEGDNPPIYNYNLYVNNQEKGRTEKEKRYSLIAGIEFAACVALCAGIFLTNVFYPNSAINTFFRSIGQSSAADARTYTDFTLSSILSEENAELNLSPTGIISFTEEGCVYPAAGGTVTEVSQNADGTWMVKISHSTTFTEIINGLSYAACSVGSNLKSNVPVGYSDGETEVQVSMYEDGALLNCFYLTESGNLAWTED